MARQWRGSGAAAAMAPAVSTPEGSRRRALLLALLARRRRQRRSRADVVAVLDDNIWGRGRTIEGRDANVRRPREGWAEVLTRYTDEEFRRAYRMTRASFDKLYGLLEGALARDTNMARRSSGYAVDPQCALAVTLRFLAGSSVRDLMALFRMAESTVYATIRGGVRAVLECDALKLHFDGANPEWCAARAAEFRAINGDTLKGCVGALDGLTVEIEKPRLTDCANPAHYYNRKGFFALEGHLPRVPLAAHAHVPGLLVSVGVGVGRRRRGGGHLGGPSCSGRGRGQDLAQRARRGLRRGGGAAARRPRGGGRRGGLALGARPRCHQHCA